MNNVIYRDRWVTIYLMSGFNKFWLEFKWADMSIPLDNLIEAHTKAIEVAVENSIKTFMARLENTKKGTELSQACLTWWGTIWVKVLVSKGVKRIISIHKKQDKIEWAMDKQKARSWETPSKNVGIEGFDLDDYNESWKGII